MGKCVRPPGLTVTDRMGHTTRAGVGRGPGSAQPLPTAARALSQSRNQGMPPGQADILRHLSDLGFHPAWFYLGLPVCLLRPANIGAENRQEEKHHRKSVNSKLYTLENWNIVSSFKMYLFFLRLWSRSFQAGNPCCTASRRLCRACLSQPSKTP